MPQEGERIAVLRAIFSCSDEVAAQFGRLVQWNRIPRREVVAHQGDLGRHCHVVVSGTADVKVLGSEGQYVQIATVEPGEIFGNYPDAAPNRADIMAREALETVSIETSKLAELARSQSQVGAGLSSIFARQLGNVLDRFSARVTLTANGRVYACLLRLAEDGPVIAPAPVVAALAMQAQTTRETASRAVGVLERRGIIAREADSWRILAPRMLEDMIV
jgi:CRP/FNR family transcriptional regulator, cyclic AMP receptor protein